MVGRAATSRRASSRSSPSFRPSVPEAIRRASIGGTRSTAAAARTSVVTLGNALRAARSLLRAASCSLSGSASLQSRYSISSKEARSASSSTEKPAMSRLPAAPSTLLRRVRAATTPSSPGAKNTAGLSLILEPASSQILPVADCPAFAPQTMTVHGRKNPRTQHGCHRRNVGEHLFRSVLYTVHGPRRDVDKVAQADLSFLLSHQRPEATDSYNLHLIGGLFVRL